MNDSLRSWLKAQEDTVVELESLLTSHKALAPENGGDGEMEKAEALISYLKAQGFTDIKQYNAPDSRVSSGCRPNVILTIPGINDDYSIWSCAHLDVVPVGELSLWKTDPWKVVRDGDKIIGRGVEDNQQGLVSGVLAALSLLKNNVKPLHTVKLLFMADEEVGSKYGMIWLLNNHRELFNKKDLILIPDGGDEKGETIEVAEKSLLWLKVHVIGQQSHGSRPDLGNNAEIASCDLQLRLHKLQEVFNEKDLRFEPPYCTFQPTMHYLNVSGVNIIPGEDTFCVDMRILPCYTIEEVLSEVSGLCDDIENEYGTEVYYETLQESESPQTDDNALVVSKLKEALKEVHGLEGRTIGIGGGTVGAELRRLGYDCVVWSTMDNRAHMPNEYAYISNTIKDAETMLYIFLN